jgi:branched-chain amino acid transport system permease protein
VSDVLQILPQQIVFGLALGSVYGLIALGYTMVYGILFMINFAHGEVFTLGAYLGWWVLALLLKEKIGGLHPAWVLPLMLGSPWRARGWSAPRWNASRTARSTPAARRGSAR